MLLVNKEIMNRISKINRMRKIHKIKIEKLIKFLKKLFFCMYIYIFLSC